MLMVTGLEEETVTQFNNDPSGGQHLPNPDDLTLPQGGTTPIMSLTGLVDLLSALEPELSELPPPYPLFAHELTVGILDRLGVKE